MADVKREVWVCTKPTGEPRIAYIGQDLATSMSGIGETVVRYVPAVAVEQACAVPAVASITEAPLHGALAYLTAELAQYQNPERAPSRIKRAKELLESVLAGRLAAPAVTDQALKNATLARMTYLVVSRLLDAFPEHYGKPGHGLLEAAHAARACMRDLWNGAESLTELPLPVEVTAVPAVAERGGGGTRMVDQGSYDKGVYDAMHGALPEYSCGYPNCDRCKAEAGKAQAEGWVSVEERLPNGSEPALVSCRSGVVISRRLAGAWRDPFNGCLYAVTHWRPIPPPPASQLPAGETER